MPADHIFISFSVATSQLGAGHQIVRDSGFGDDVWTMGEFNPGYGQIRVRRNDPRAARLLSQLKNLGVDVRPRFDREYSRSELDAAKFLRLRLETIGLVGSATLPQQQWDRQHSCLTCGSGSRPLAPLVIDPTRMARKLLEMTAYDGRLVIAASIVDSLRQERLTGIEPKPVCNKKGAVDVRWNWLDVTYQWPPVARPDLLYTSNPCPACRRAGHFDAWERPIAQVYAQLPDETADFGLTYELYGEWTGFPHGSSLARVGGAQAVIVSQRARRVLMALGVRKLAFEPIFAATDPLISDWPMNI